LIGPPAVPRNQSNHPVWYAYNELRTARLNVCYYQSRLAAARKRNAYQEIILAASASTAVAGLWFLTNPVGAIVWKGLGTVAAVLAVYRTVFKPSEKVPKLEAHVIAWTDMEVALAQLRRRIHEDGQYTHSHSRELDTIQERKKAILGELVEDEPDRRLLEVCYARVNDELPPESFYVPNE
jgi:hypothetical protein